MFLERQIAPNLEPFVYPAKKEFPKKNCKKFKDD